MDGGDAEAASGVDYGAGIACVVLGHHDKAEAGGGGATAHEVDGEHFFDEVAFHVDEELVAQGGPRGVVARGPLGAHLGGIECGNDGGGTGLGGFDRAEAEIFGEELVQPAVGNALLREQGAGQVVQGEDVDGRSVK